ncbi:hypothetical protein JOC75_000833 [Metabacillus crassostreae]|nr:hypothetical protein [Metabacillus crassostreae]
MIYKILLIMAMVIFVLELYISPTFFNVEPDDTGLFLGLTFLCIILGKLLSDNHKKKDV